MDLILLVADPTPERDKSPDPGRDWLGPVPDMDCKKLRLSLNPAVPAPLHNPAAPVRVGPTIPRGSRCLTLLSSQRSNWVVRLRFRTPTSPKTGTRPCSNRYTKYLVRAFCPFFTPALCVCVCVRASVHALMFCHTVFCLSIAALRASPGKPLSPHLHFPREL